MNQVQSRILPWVATMAAGVLLAGCGGDDGAEDAQAEGEENQEESQQGSDVPAGFQTVDTGVITFALPEDWEESSGGGETLGNQHDLVDADGTRVALAGMVPFEIENEDMETLPAQAATEELAGQLEVGQPVMRNMEANQDAEVPGARDASRNDYVFDEAEIAEIEENNVTDLAVITEGENELVVFRLTSGDDTLSDSERQEIIDSVQAS